MADVVIATNQVIKDI